MWESESNAERGLVAAVRVAFPVEAASIDERMARDGFEPDQASHVWLEHFSQRTTDAMKAGDFAAAKAHLQLMSSLFEGGDAPARRCIDVAYVEALMWDVADP